MGSVSSHGSEAQTRGMSAVLESTRAGSTTARFPCTHVGSIGLSQGLRRGRRQPITRPPPAYWAGRGWPLEPFLPRLADVPGGLVPDAQARPLALGGTVCGPPGQQGAGDRADGTPVDTASPPVVGRGPREPITGPRV